MYENINIKYIYLCALFNMCLLVIINPTNIKFYALHNKKLHFLNKFLSHFTLLKSKILNKFYISRKLKIRRIFQRDSEIG